MKKYLKIVALLFFLLCLFIFINAYSYVNAVSYDLSESVFRLHVIANSDSDEDQNLKYIVRDSIISSLNNLCKNSSSKDETVNIVSNNLDYFENIANETIKNNGFSYKATVELGNFEFPTKNYANISFPAGYYDALKVKIGNAEGKNWWCVLYPSLCFINTSSGFIPDESKEDLKENLNSEEYEIISNSDKKTISFKFKLIEFFTQNRLITAKNN